MPVVEDEKKWGPEGFAGMAEAWEKCDLVRSRFRRSLTWLQYPIPGPVPCKKDEQGEETKVKDPRAPSTRALELNYAILDSMLDNYSGEFLDIDRLTREADF